MDNNATKTLVQLINPAIQLESATEDDIITLLLGCQTKVFKLTYDNLTIQVSEVLLKYANVTKDIEQRIKSLAGIFAKCRQGLASHCLATS